MLPLRADWNASRHFPPLLKTRTATTGTSVLCDENGMASHWRLLPVVLRVGRCQPHANKILAMTADHFQTLVRYVLPVRSRKAKAASKLRSAESQKCRIECTLVRHGRRYTFSTFRLISSTCPRRLARAKEDCTCPPKPWRRRIISLWHRHNISANF